VKAGGPVKQRRQVVGDPARRQLSVIGLRMAA
jgi:hypothetical protein